MRKPLIRRAAVVFASIPLLAGLSACSAAMPAAAPDEPSDGASDGPVVAFYGDSYTLGTGASDPSNRWSTIICTGRGWTEVNPSVNGLGFVNNRGAAGEGSGDLPDLIIAEQPDIVIVTLGLNDNFSYDRAGTRIRDRIEDDFERLSTELPDARIIVVEPFWYTDERPESVDVIIGWVHDAAVGIDAETIEGASRWIEGHPEWIASDGLHPNDDGYAVIAERMDEELTGLGL
jgi:lysophospholipase L1-like esterase